jgi:hypothetical protein
MRRTYIGVAMTLAVACTSEAQDLLGKVSCHAAGLPTPENPPYTRTLWNGYEVSLGPARNSQGGGDECTAAITNRNGRVVFRTTGFSVIFDENHTGQDFDGDGRPDVVFITDSGGGNHCCWSYNVISLSPKPHKLFDINAPGAVRFERDRQGKIVVWQRTPGPYGFSSMAQAPFAERVFRVRAGKLVDATSEFCSYIFSDENDDYRAWTRGLTRANLDRLTSAATTSIDNEEIISDLLSRALQHVFCQQFDSALNDLNQWPEATRATMLAGFVDALKMTDAALAAKLIDAASKK